jgi:signal transduction histidine kinase
MNKIRFNNLFWRLSAVFFVLLTFIGLTYVYITAHYSGRYFEQVNQRLNRNIASDIASHSEPLINGEVNAKATEKLFDRVMNVNPSLEIYLLNNDGKILSFYAPGKKIKLDKINLTPLKRFISTSGNEFITGEDPRHPEIEKVFSVAPVINNGAQQGYIYVVLASEQYEEISKNLSGNYLLQVGSRAMILTLLATLVVGLIIIQIITRNLTRILEVMEQFSKGDMKARIRVQSTGEINQVSKIFNEMADILSDNIEKLKELEILRRELVANVSHDLRTPISIIRGYIETLQMKEYTLSAVERRAYLETVSESAIKLEKLVNELFELSKLEANQIQAVKEPFFISELSSDIINKYQLLAKQKDIDLTSFLSTELPMVFADVALIERVMQNLLDNAIKFTPVGGKIIIRTSACDRGAEISVSDSGKGIPEYEQDKIFSRYYTAGNFRESKNSTGLGLAIVKKILDLHDSPLFIYSKINQGTSFVFTLPEYKKK